MELQIKIADEQWEPIGDEEDAWSRIILRDGVRINGTGFHLEGWSVQNVDHIQTADYQDEDLGLIHRGVGADGFWDTVEIRGREYVLVASPYC